MAAALPSRAAAAREQPSLRICSTRSKLNNGTTENLSFF
jgi:hypothetical protein